MVLTYFQVFYTAYEDGNLWVLSKTYINKRPKYWQCISIRNILLSTIYNTTRSNSHSNRYFWFIMISSCNLFHCRVFQIFNLLGEP